MDTVITVTVIIVGMLMIHLLNAQHDERITAFHYSDALPGIGRRSRKGRRAVDPAGPPVVTTHHEHQDRGHG